METGKRKRPGIFQKRCEGSALLLTLIIVSLMLVVVLSLVVVVRMELRAVRNRQETLEARANAKLAAMIALSELQRSLGPDTRVSALADMVNSNTPDASGAAHETTRFWTGAWDSSQEWLGSGDPEAAGPLDAKPYRPYKGDRTNRFLSWMVSSPTALASNIDFVQTQVTGSSVPMAVITAVPQGGGSPVSTEIRAPLVDLVGDWDYAWWVSDEGVKANITLSDPYRGQSQTGLDDIPRYLFPHRENFSATSWFEETDFDDTQLIIDLDKLGVGTNVPWFAFRNDTVSDDAEDAMSDVTGNRIGDSLFQDYTLYSKGVISNTKKGGLRKDLSLAFWRDPDEIDDPTGGTPNEGFNTDFSNRDDFLGRIFNKEDYPLADRIVNSSTTGVFFGPQWDALRDYHNSYQKLENPDSASPAAYLDTLRVISSPTTGQSFNPRGLFGGNNNTERNSLHEAGSETSKGEVLTLRSNGGWQNRGGMISSPMTPVVLGAQFNFQVNVEQIAVDEYRPLLKVTTVVTLWNPYNVSIRPLQLTGTNPASWNLQSYVGDFEFVFEKDGAEVERRLLSEFLPDNNRGGIGLEIMNSGSTLEFLPGEIRQYRLSSVNTLTPNFSEDALEFPVTGLSFASADELGVRMEVDDSRNQVGGNTFSGVRFDFFAAGGAGAYSAMQMVRFDLFSEEESPEYYDSSNVGGLVGADDLFIGGIEFAVKSAEEPDSNVAGVLSNFNPRALFPGGALVSNYPGIQPPNYIARIVSTPVTINSDGSDTSRLRGYWGGSRDASDGESYIPLFDVPRRPPESLGQYQHANLSIFGSQPAYAFGNSLAHPHVDRSFAHDVHSGGISQIDLSWFLNDAIWDDYFLSTLDPDAADPSSPQRERFLELDPDRVFDVANSEDYKRVAENLLIRGAFNVNSTSVEAWTAFLSALGSENTPSGDLEFPYYRHSAIDEFPNTAWLGGPRNLTRAQVRRFAEEMVDQVKERGPFLSLSDFVNRRLESGDTGAMGALQAAIEAAGLNTVVSSDSSSLPDAPEPSNVIGKTAMLAPGDLSQADVLTTIAPKMSVRSDTFVIRAFSRSVSLDVNVWVEMVVQRMPEEHEQPAFGRRFEILQFRYLDEDEI